VHKAGLALVPGSSEKVALTLPYSRAAVNLANQVGAVPVSVG
jgi:hypothetical protein